GGSRLSLIPQRLSSRQSYVGGRVPINSGGKFEAGSPRRIRAATRADSTPSNSPWYSRPPTIPSPIWCWYKPLIGACETACRRTSASASLYVTPDASRMYSPSRTNECGGSLDTRSSISSNDRSFTHINFTLTVNG